MSPRGDICTHHLATYVCACDMRTCAHTCVIIGLSILLRIYAKPIKCALFIYPIVCLNLYHVGLIFFILMFM